METSRNSLERNPADKTEETVRPLRSRKTPYRFQKVVEETFAGLNHVFI